MGIEELEFELDCCVAFNMMLGKSYEDAESEALVWMADARDSDTQNGIDPTDLEG